MIATPPVVFTFNGPSNFVTSSTITYWETIQGGEAWVAMVRAYLRLKQLPVPPGVRDPFNSPDHILIFIPTVSSPPPGNITTCRT